MNGCSLRLDFTERVNSFTMQKGVVEEFLGACGNGMKSRSIMKPASRGDPGRQANVVYGGTVIGYVGEVHPKVLANYNIGQRAYLAVLDMPCIVEKASFDRKYEGIAKYPAVTRDISMVVPKTVLAGQIENILTQRGGKDNGKLFPVLIFMKGNRSKKATNPWRNQTSRAKDRTLEDADITAHEEDFKRSGRMVSSCASKRFALRHGGNNGKKVSYGRTDQ